MDKLNEKVTHEEFIKLINLISSKRDIKTQLSSLDSPFQIIIKLNKILVGMKMIKMSKGFNILDEEIAKLILIDKESLSEEEYRRIYVYFYFYNSIIKLEEMPPQFKDDDIIQIMIEIIQKDNLLENTYSFLGGEILLNKD